MSRQVLKVAGLVALAILGTIYLINPSFAADKGAPPAKIDAQGNEKPLFTGCYGQLGAQGLFADGNDTVKAFAVGAGCDWQLGSVVVGANGRYAFGSSVAAFSDEDFRAIYLGGRVGYAVNPHTLFYGHASFLMDGRSPKFADSSIIGGIGVETYLNKQMTIFLEAATDLGKWGEFSELPKVYEVHGGLRIRF